jgi:hypothetical protein
MDEKKSVSWDSFLKNLWLEYGHPEDDPEPVIQWGSYRSK